MDIFFFFFNGEIPCNSPYEDEIVKVIMDVNPVNPGHLLIIPKKHYTDIIELDNNTSIHIHEVAQKLINKMMNTLEGINSVKVVVNYGEEQVVKHYHMHLIPFYNNKPSLSQEDICNLLK